MKIPNDDRFRAYIIDRLIPFPRVLEANGFEDYSYEGKCFCPFHDNYESPAAKIYHDVKGDTLWCFSEQKRYRPSDLYKKKLATKGTIYSVSDNLWKQLSEDRQQDLLTDYQNPVDYVPEGWEENQQNLLKFRKGEISFSEHLNLLRSIL